MKLPPYAKYLYNLQQINELPINDVYIFMGKNAWKKADGFQISRPTTMCLPPGQDPEQYDWPVAGCDILVFDTSFSPEEYVFQVARCLLAQGAQIVRYVSADFFSSTFTKDS